MRLQRGRATRARRTPRRRSAIPALRRFNGAEPRGPGEPPTPPAPFSRATSFNGAEPRGPGELPPQPTRLRRFRASTGPSHEGPENCECGPRSVAWPPRSEPRGPGEHHGPTHARRDDPASTGPSHEGPENDGRVVGREAHDVLLQRGRATRARRTPEGRAVRLQRQGASTGPSHEGPENSGSRRAAGSAERASTGPSHEGPENQLSICTKNHGNFRPRFRAPSSSSHN